MSFVSYAQNFEDVLLVRALAEVESGFYIDVGAQHPVNDSVTKAFYERGWHGINLEPVAEWHALLQADRPRDLNLQVAVSDRSGMLKLFEIEATGMSTAAAQFAEHHRAAGHALREIEVPCRTLSEICAEHKVGEIHFLKIDVEGQEGHVLRGFDLRRWRPWIILLESTLPNTMTSVHHEWEGVLLAADYVFVHFDGLNRFYVPREREAQLRERLTLPPNHFDQFIRHHDRLAHESAHQRALDLQAEQHEHVQTRALVQRWSDRAAELDGMVNRLADQSENRLKAMTDAQQALAEVQQALAAERAESARLRDNLNQQRNRAAQAEDELARTYASRSWRVTLPLRLASAEAQRLEPRIRAQLADRNSPLRRSVRILLEAGLALVRAIPGLKPFIARAVSGFPRLDAHLRGFARARSDGAPPPPASSVAPGQTLPPLPVFRNEPIEPRPQSLRHRLPTGQRTLYFYVDHTALCPVNTGMQRVTRGLARSLRAAGERLCFVKWDFVRRQIVLVNRDELVHLARWQGPLLDAAEMSQYPEAGAPGLALPQHERDDGNWLVVPEVTYINFHPAVATVDVIVAAKVAGLASAFVFYDAIPLRRPELAGSADKHKTYMQQLLLADLIVPISRWSGDDLDAFLERYESANLHPTPAIRVLPLPGESQLSARATAGAASSVADIGTDAGTGKRKIILAVGTVERRKNQVVLVQAFEAFHARHPGLGWELVLVGNIHPEVAGEINAATARLPAIQAKAHLSDEALLELFHDCAFTVFPSVEEGFGLPILESLWHGKPCICANFGAMAEVAAGGGCLMIDTRDSQALLSAIETLALQPAERLRLERQAVDRPLSTWADYGRDFARLLDEESEPLRRLGTIYYCVEHTCGFEHNTGIQRVVRGLGRALQEIGCVMVPVRWDAGRRRLHAASTAELEHMARWNGPSVDRWRRDAVPEQFGPRDWMIMPELTVYPGGPNLEHLKQFSVDSGLRVAWVFYDAIPFKMRDLYAPQWSQAHADYMRAISGFERVLAISEHSARDLRQFLASIPERTPEIERRVQACVLPGEFRETARIVEPKAAHEGPLRILSVGSVEPRKNHRRLIEAFALARQRSSRPLELQLAGGCHLPEPAAAEFRALVAGTPGLTWEERADDSRLRELYAAADFTIYPSLEEGFGLPILESLWNARPCICRDQGAMAEVAHGGGCLTVDTAQVEPLANAIVRLASEPDLLALLGRQAVSRPFRTWVDYARDFATVLARERSVPGERAVLPAGRADALVAAMVNLPPAPLLSICITTYNRAPWLALSLANLVRLLPEPMPGVELVVCDNTSTDNTPEVVQPYLGRADFRYQRNPVNVGMLGNLQATAHLARGKFVWILGDDDLVKPGAIERVLGIVREHPELALIYLNYAYTHEDDAGKVTDVDRFLAESTPIVKPGPDIFGPIRSISTESENFFTAIYCLVFRRDHAMRAYSQNTQGRPFSTMLTCIPTTYHVLHEMMGEPGCWVGSPQLVVNMNVSWAKYASLWILERLPEMFDRAEVFGAEPLKVDRWREHNVPGVVHFFREIFEKDPAGNIEFFDAARLVARFKHVEAFRREVPLLKSIYQAARDRGAPGTSATVEEVFAAFQTS